MLDYGLKPSDALHIASMNKMGIRHIVSEDKEFDKIPFIERM
ncbi:MAG: type II toxin-antitoxin system VapC family toxin, partial [Thermoproteota archaeon]